MWNICGSALTAPVRVLTAMQLHLPHGPNPFARHLAMRRGIPRTSRCKYEKDSPGKSTEYEFSSCPARCLNCVAEICLPTCKSSISRRVRSRRKRAQTVSMGFKSPLHGGNQTSPLQIAELMLDFRFKHNICTNKLHPEQQSTSFNLIRTHSALQNMSFQKLLRNQPETTPLWCAVAQRFPMFYGASAWHHQKLTRTSRKRVWGIVKHEDSKTTPKYARTDPKTSQNVRLQKLLRNVLSATPSIRSNRWGLMRKPRNKTE